MKSIPELLKETSELLDQMDDVIIDLRVLNIETQEHMEVAADLLKQINENIELLDNSGNTISKKIIISDKIHTLSDLLTVAKIYGTPEIDKHVNVNTRILYDLIEPLEKLNKIIGMDEIKNSIVDLILTSMQRLYDPKTLFHTVITGPPGVGKTMLAKILGEIYLRVGVLVNEDNKYIFKNAKRSDLIGKYLGHTAMKTQELIDSCVGGVLFIDEVYSLGNEEKRDSFSKECIDTINLNLTEKENFICIIAGYPDEIENCFFSVNPGLKRRYPFRYDIQGYTYDQLTEIFISKLTELDWKLDINKDDLSEFFKDNQKKLQYFGGDIDNLIMGCKTCHSRRIFGQDDSLRKILTFEDIAGGFGKLLEHKNKNNVENNDYLNRMYL